MLDFTRFRALTFDCYGTLIDWEAGIFSVLRPLLIAHGQRLEDGAILGLYGELEADAEHGEFCLYRSVLEAVVQGFGRRLGFVASEAERRALPESMANWQPFPDTVAALQRLKTRYSLNIISNVDDHLFAASARRLQVQFDQVTTAQQARSYKPSSNNFLLALQKIGIPREEVLHVGQSIYHDVVPAQELGLATVWVNRRSPRPGAGATKPAEAKPDLEVPDLKTLADLACPSEPLRP